MKYDTTLNTQGFKWPLRVELDKILSMEEKKVCLHCTNNYTGGTEAK